MSAANAHGPAGGRKRLIHGLHPINHTPRRLRHTKSVANLAGVLQGLERVEVNTGNYNTSTVVNGRQWQVPSLLHEWLVEGCGQSTVPHPRARLSQCVCHAFRGVAPPGGRPTQWRLPKCCTTALAGKPVPEMCPWLP